MNSTLFYTINNADISVVLNYVSFCFVCKMGSYLLYSKYILIPCSESSYETISVDAIRSGVEDKSPCPDNNSRTRNCLVNNNEDSSPGIADNATAENMNSVPRYNNSTEDISARLENK